MTDDLRESVSALMDDEANELEVHRVLSNMEESDEVRDTWKRYQLASFAMKGKLPQNIDIDISARVAEAIADEEVEFEPVVPVKSSSWGRILKPMTSVAVAASVALVVVFGALQVNQTETIPGVANQTTPNTDKLIASGAAIPNQSVVPVSDESLSASEKRLRALIDSHTQQADLSRSRAFMPYAQLVSDRESQR